MRTSNQRSGGRGVRPVKSLTFAAVCLGTTVAFTGPHFDVFAATVLLDGLAPLLNVAAATLCGVAVVRRVVPDVNRPLLVAAGAGTGLGLLSTLTLALGLVGWLNGVTAWALVAALTVVGLIDLRRNPLPKAGWSTSQRSAWLWLFAAPAFGVMLVAATLPPGLLWGGEPNGYDVTSYHLQIPREWYELGRIAPLPHNAFSYFPMAQEALSLGLMHQAGGPWRAMYAAQLLSTLLCGLTVLAAAGAATADAGESDAAPGVVAGLLVAGAPWVAVLGGIAYDEPMLLLATALAAAFLVRAVDTPAPGRAAMLAGLFVGLGAATKYPAVPMLGVAGGGALLVALGWWPGRNAPAELNSPRRRLGRVAVASLAFSLGASAFALPWLVRNVAWVGNPIFPLGAGLFGHGGWTAEQVARWGRAHAPAADATRLGRLLGEVLLNPDYGLALWPFVFAAAGVGLLRPGRRLTLLGLWLAGMFVVWLGFTHLQGRFFVVAIPVAAVAAGLLVGRVPRRGRPLLLGFAAASAAVGFGFVGPRLWASIPQFTESSVTAIGVGSLSFATPFERPQDALGRDVYLVGDARAFNYEVGRVHYKVVFSVPPAEGAVRAWLGDALETADDDALVVIDPTEIARLSRTYGTPPLEPAVAAVVGFDGPTILPMRGVRQALAVPAGGVVPTRTDGGALGGH